MSNNGSGQSRQSADPQTSCIVEAFASLRAKCRELSAARKQVKTQPDEPRRNSRNVALARITPAQRAFALQPMFPAGWGLPHGVDYFRSIPGFYSSTRAICNAFKGVVRVANSGWPEARVSRQTQRVPPLFELCVKKIAMCIGGCDEEDMEDVVGKMEREEKELGDLLAVYESIPPHYRREIMTAHAVNHILDTCPHHPSLLTALWETALTERLLRETEKILHALLVATFDPTYQCHEVQFFTLFDKSCRSRSKLDPLVSYRSYSNILVSAIEESTTDPTILWSLDCVQGVGQTIRREDFEAYAHFCVGIARAFSQSPRAEEVRPHLASATVSMITCFLGAGTMSPEHLSSHHHAASEFVCQLHALGYTVRSGSVTNDIIVESIICLALYCVSLSTPDLGQDMTDALFDVLRNTVPLTETYFYLVQFALPMGAVKVPELWITHDVLEWGKVLRKNRLFAHEAALYVASLERIDELLAQRPLYIRPPQAQLIAKLEEMRAQIVYRAKKTERFYFSEEKDSVGMDATKWRWEETAESWVRRLPVQVVDSDEDIDYPTASAFDPFIELYTNNTGTPYPSRMTTPTQPDESSHTIPQEFDAQTLSTLLSALQHLVDQPHPTFILLALPSSKSDGPPMDKCCGNDGLTDEERDRRWEHSKRAWWAMQQAEIESLGWESQFVACDFANARGCSILRVLTSQWS
ncbi:hypothetical protein BXZ70DRAFT_1012622 [Cristinia sonorae]|uniref:Uncharacterized protein n=1 Tax=Cristinia sonorae TaxID=1940300 RepID=A0A8K0XK70_9AGAR|nr:hypothetical protein BXZ70DRAFT_1012622 [Cristinia sonorae]